MQEEDKNHKSSLDTVQHQVILVAQREEMGHLVKVMKELILLINHLAPQEVLRV